MIIFCSGDIFLSKAKCLAHGCNLVGAMGAGIAKQFKEKYKEMYLEYYKVCKLGRISTGKNFIYKVDDNKIVINMITQELFYDAKIEYIRFCCEDLLSGVVTTFQGKKEEVESLAMPLIGAGLGGLQGNEVKDLLKEVFENSKFPVFVYDKFEVNKESAEEKAHFKCIEIGEDMARVLRESRESKNES